MKKTIFLQSLICLLAVSCTVRELDVITPAPAEDLVFYASLESSETDTRVSLDEYTKILWDVDDRITIFNKSTLNQQFKFGGEKPGIVQSEGKGRITEMTGSFLPHFVFD